MSFRLEYHNRIMPPHITTNYSITNKHYVNDLKIALQNANKSGNDLKVVTQDGSVYIRKDVLVIWSPLFQDILSSISEPKISISLNDVSIDSVKNIKTIMMSGEVKKNLNHAEIQGVIHAGKVVYKDRLLEIYRFYLKVICLELTWRMFQTLLSTRELQMILLRKERYRDKLPQLCLMIRMSRMKLDLIRKTSRTDQAPENTCAVLLPSPHQLH